MRRFLTLCLILAAGCASGRGGMSEAEILAQAPLVNAEDAPAAPPAEAPASGLSEEDARQRLQAARDAWLRGDLDSCLRIVRATLEEGAPEPVSTELRQLRFDAGRRLVSRRVVRARALPVRDVLAMGEPARFELLLRNVADLPVRILRSLPGSSDTVFFLEVTREDWDIFGNVRAETRKETLAVAEDIVLAPATARSIEFEWPTPEPSDRHLGFTILTVEGVLRPAAIEAGEQEAYAAVEVAPGRILALPPGYEPLAGDPIGSIRQAHGLGAREHLLVAVALVGPERRDAATETLIDLLTTEPTAMTITVMAGLRHLTGRSFANRPEAWREWRKEERPR